MMVLAWGEMVTESSSPSISTAIGIPMSDRRSLSVILEVENGCDRAGYFVSRRTLLLIMSFANFGRAKQLFSILCRGIAFFVVGDSTCLYCQPTIDLHVVVES
jgi:hypothetical protein